MIKLFLTYSLIMLAFKFYIYPFQINPSRHKKIHISKGDIQNGKKMWKKFSHSLVVSIYFYHRKLPCLDEVYPGRGKIKFLYHIL